MFNLYIYGYSDDLIEIDGDWREEFYSPLTGRAFVIFSDGTIVESNYDGDWYFRTLVSGHNNRVSGHHPAPYLGDEITDVPGYSEVIYLSFDEKPEWTAVATTWKKIK